MIKASLYTLAEAILHPGDIGYDPKIKGTSDFDLGYLLGQVYLYMGMLAVLIIVIAGFIFITANGDANRIAAAKRALMSAIVGLLIILFAFAITQFVISWVAR